MVLGQLSCFPPGIKAHEILRKKLAEMGAKGQRNMNFETLKGRKRETFLEYQSENAERAMILTCKPFLTC